MLPLALGLFLCSLCVLFPPRQIKDTGPTSVPRVFLFSEDIGVRRVHSRIGREDALYLAEIDAGRLLAEFLLICCAEGFVLLFLLLWAPAREGLVRPDKER